MGERNYSNLSLPTFSQAQPWKQQKQQVGEGRSHELLSVSSAQGCICTTWVIQSIFCNNCNNKWKVNFKIFLNVLFNLKKLETRFRKDIALWTQTTWAQILMSIEKMKVSVLNSLKFQNEINITTSRVVPGSLYLTLPPLILVNSSTQDIFPKQRSDQVIFLSQTSPRPENIGQPASYAFLYPLETDLSLPFPDHLWSFISIHFSLQPDQNRFIIYFQPLIAVHLFGSPPQSFPTQIPLLVLGHLANSCHPSKPRLSPQLPPSQLCLELIPEETKTNFHQVKQSHFLASNMKFYLASNMKKSRIYLTTK